MVPCCMLHVACCMFDGFMLYVAWYIVSFCIFVCFVFLFACSLCVVLPFSCYDVMMLHGTMLHVACCVVSCCMLHGKMCLIELLPAWTFCLLGLFACLN